jgi:hypothetical protein
MQKQRLDSWKSIAEYLDRSTRTVQRWHADYGLPVHHFHGPKGPVFAYSDEIDAWLPGFRRKANDSSDLDDSASEAKRRSIELTSAADELWEIRSERNIHSVSRMYRDAIDEDAGNSAAFAGLANATIYAAINGMVEGSIAYPRAQEALHRMSRIDPGNLDGRCGAAWLDLVWKRKWGKARTGFDEVLINDPRNANALLGRALLSVSEGHLSEAWRFTWEAWRLNTLAHSISAVLCWIPYLAGEYGKALQQISDLRVSGAHNATHAAIEALALIQSGSLKPHLDKVESFSCNYPHDRTLQGALGYYYGRSNQPTRALAMLEEIKNAGDPSNCAYAVALLLIGLDRPQEAIHSLEASYAAGSKWSLGFRCDPMLKPLRDDRRFRELLRKAGPGSSYLAAGRSASDSQERSSPA